MSVREWLVPSGKGSATPDAAEEYRIYTCEPETLNVAQLNRAVKALREVRYQSALRIARLETALRDIEAHHGDQNDRAHRPQDRSRTLRICRDALASTWGKE